MKSFRLSQSSALTAFFSLLIVVCGCSPKSDASLQKKLVGTWRISPNPTNFIRGDLTFTIASNGAYTCNITLPEAHTLAGAAEIKNGFLILTVTNRDNTNVSPPLVQRETILRLDESELVSQPEGSSVPNVFQKSQRNP